MPSKKYQTPEEARQGAARRQQELRARRQQNTFPLDRAAVEALMEAVQLAAFRGDPEAKAVLDRSPDGLLRNLAKWWQERGS